MVYWSINSIKMERVIKDVLVYRECRREPPMVKTNIGSYLEDICIIRM